MRAILFYILAMVQIVQAQDRNSIDPRLTENWGTTPQVMMGKSINWDAPADAIQLLGKNLEAWTKLDGSKAEWTMDGDIVTVKPGGGDIVTKQSFGDCHLHVEWRSPKVIKGEGQGRGNSGIFLQSRYEVQVLDSYNNETYYNGQAGSIYKQTPPLKNATAKTGEWNTYDIIYRAPKFDVYGKLIETARVTLIHNGIVVQNNTEIMGTTEYRGAPEYKLHGGAPIILQDHGDLVSYRNIWIRRL